MNHLKDQTSPYLLQHAENPVDWYPWCEEAFEKAKKEDKPVFLSIGYSTCHWCHVMAHESFEDPNIAKLLNDNFVSIKVDREERPDIDAVYMSACIAMTGSGGWPMSVFLTPEQKPFFAGTYFPKLSTRGMTGFSDLLSAVAKSWKTQRNDLIASSERVLSDLRVKEKGINNAEQSRTECKESLQLIENGLQQLKRSFDREYGGFGFAPKFPAGHNLLFLLHSYERTKDQEALHIAEKTLLQMYKGGIYDHIGGGFSRYSTDKYFLAPHFEKMLYDNALLIVCYCKAYQITKKKVYLDVAERTAGWILREMQSGKGAFYSSQDADSQGEEGKFYTFTYDELQQLLGPEEGNRFSAHYGVSGKGNFDGKNILHLLFHEEPDELDSLLRKKVYDYRRNRFPLHTDDKILTAWNGMAIWAFTHLYRTTKDRRYLQEAERTLRFFLGKISSHSVSGKTSDGNDSVDYSDLFVSWRDGNATGKGFLDDYAWFICGLLGLYEATSDMDYLYKAERFTRRALRNFFNADEGGFHLWGRENEALVLNPVEVYDGAMPSGNSVMSFNLVKLVHYTRTEKAAFEAALNRQMDYMTSACSRRPSGHCFFLLALSMDHNPSEFYTCRDGVCAPLGRGEEK